jgi:diadenosine tetraphosphatase ApaH/serine/threonine PP2A family protein phosphatase
MGFTIVHSTLDSPDHYRYAFDKQDAEDSFNYQRKRVSFHGHTHVPCIFRRTTTGASHGILKLGAANGLLDQGNYFINVGSVGQPRDGIPKACYLIFTAEGLTKLSIEFRRVDYEIEAAVQRIKDAGLPERLINRLYTGQ